MRPGLSTYAFFDHRLHPGHLDALLSAGASTIEVFAARHHFDYTSAPELRELAAWFRSNPVDAVLHQPVYVSDRADAQWSRHVAANLNLIALQKMYRIAAMDEVKRAIEAAEHVPFKAIVLHLGLKGDAWDEAALDLSLTAIEHLKAFAAPLGVRLLLENLQNDVATPEHLLYIVKTGHFDSVGICLDLGHLHLAQDAAPPVAASKADELQSAAARDSGLAAAIALLGARIGQVHLHDNHGPFGTQPTSSSTFADAKDEHLWPSQDSAADGAPSDGTINWSAIVPQLTGSHATLPDAIPGILEAASDRDEPVDSITRKAAKALRMFAPAD